jgi:hypothetical protein
MGANIRNFWICEGGRGVGGESFFCDNKERYFSYNVAIISTHF